mgnify:CR=1 FL=1
MKGKVIEILSYLGYEWPTTDVGVLEGWSADWTSLAGRLESYVRDLEAGVAHLRGANEGLAVESVVGHLSGGEGSLESLRSVAAAAPLAATAYRAAGVLITGLRAYVIGQILLDVVSVAAAILSGGASAAVSFLAKKGATMAINIAIDQAINELMGG